MTGAEWVGYLAVDGMPRMIKVAGELVPAGVAEFALPGERLFRLEVRFAEGSDGRLTGEVLARGETIQFSGSSEDGEVFTGMCETSAGQGFVELRRVAIWELDAYRKLSAQYEVGGGRRISVQVNADEWVGAPVMFYAEGNRFVRLYPDAVGRLLSEDGECFVMSPDRGDLESMHLLSGSSVAVTRAVGWIDESVAIDGPAGRLAGTLMTPPGPGPHPGVVMIHGAAGGRRDYYRAFAEPFVQCGVAALVYDRRGWGESAGNPDPSFGEKAADAQAWVDYLCSRSDIQGDRVGVWGFSNGSWIAPMVAARSPQVAFVCVIGAAGTTPVETEIHRRAFDLRKQGIPAEQVEWIQRMWRIIYALELSREPDEADRRQYDELAAAVAASTELAQITVQEYAVLDPYLGPVPPYASYEEALADLPGPDDPVEETDLWTNDPVDSYRVITAPVLFLAGVDDSNLPAVTSAERVSSALQQAGNHDSIVALFPNTGHAMNLGQPDVIGMNDEELGYRLHNYRFAGGYLDLIRQWIETRVVRPSSASR